MAREPGSRCAPGRAQIMGILNVTPDSFSDGGLFLRPEQAVARALAMVEEGADIIDVGGESTRPGAEPVPADQELQRVVPVIEAIRKASDVAISIDTSKPEVMRAAVAAGATMINDVTALAEPDAIATVSRLGVPVCLMHMQGTPRTMQQHPHYDDVVREVRDFLEARIGACVQGGIRPERILIDPGFGFGKTLAHNLTLLRGLAALKTLGAPILVGLSRKSMIGQALGLPVERRLYPSLALALIAVQNGAKVVRVHDVRPTREILQMYETVYGSARE